VLTPLLRRSAVALAATALAATGLAGPASAARVQAGTHPAAHGGAHAARHHHRHAGWYVAMGDSLAAGYQPGAGDDKTGGYVGHVRAALASGRHKVGLDNVACSGETSSTLVFGGLCSYPRGSQLAQAVQFLKHHARSTRLVTLTIGANDVTPCLQVPSDQILTCVQQKLAVLSQNLQTTLGAVHSAAPTAQIIVTNYYNPYLALYFTNPALATQTSALQQGLNATIAGVTSAFGGQTADVATAFDSFDTTLTPTGIPTNVAMVCTYTWMCLKGNIHANDLGYALMATAVVAKL